MRCAMPTSMLESLEDDKPTVACARNVELIGRMEEELMPAGGMPRTAGKLVKMPGSCLDATAVAVSDAS